MDDIARHLTVSKKTLYQHFADKEDLITVVLSSHIEDNRKQYEVITENSANAIDELAQISQCLRKDRIAADVHHFLCFFERGHVHTVVFQHVRHRDGMRESVFVDRTQHHRFRFLGQIFVAFFWGHFDLALAVHDVSSPIFIFVDRFIINP